MDRRSESAGSTQKSHGGSSIITYKDRVVAQEVRDNKCISLVCLHAAVEIAATCTDLNLLVSSIWLLKKY